MSRASPDNSAKENFSRIVESGQLWRMFYEPSRQAEGMAGFAEGYMQSNLAALAYLLEVGGELTLETIGEAHKRCMKEVKEGEYHDKGEDRIVESQGSAGELREKIECSGPGECLYPMEAVEFKQDVDTPQLAEHNRQCAKEDGDYIEATATMVGVKELFQRATEDDACPFELFLNEVDESKPGLISCYEQFLERFPGKDPTECLDLLIKRVETLFNSDTLPPLVIRVQGGPCCRHYFQNNIDQYNREITSANALSDESERQDAALRAIATFVKFAGVGHPYQDGTGRLFQMLLPIKLCLDNNITPPMLNVIMHFYTGCSVDEIVYEMKMGIDASVRLADAVAAGDKSVPLPSTYPADDAVAAQPSELLAEVRAGEAAVLAVLEPLVALQEASADAADTRARMAKMNSEAGRVSPSPDDAALEAELAGRTPSEVVALEGDRLDEVASDTESVKSAGDAGPAGGAGAGDDGVSASITRRGP